jgi:hypothetical protein
MLEDCCASYTPEFHAVAVKMVSAQCGIFGSVTDSKTFVGKLDNPSTTSSSSGSDYEVISTPSTGSNTFPSVDKPLSSILTKPISVDAKPYEWPYNRNMTPGNTCIIVIDMQVDFCAKYVHHIISCFLFYCGTEILTGLHSRAFLNIHFNYLFAEVDMSIQWDMTSN